MRRPDGCASRVRMRSIYHGNVPTPIKVTKKLKKNAQFVVAQTVALSRTCLFRQSNSSVAASGNIDLEEDLKCPTELAGFSSTIKVKGFLQLIEGEFRSQTAVLKALALCDSACSHLWLTRSLADRLNLRGQSLIVTVKGINS